MKAFFVVRVGQKRDPGLKIAGNLANVGLSLYRTMEDHAATAVVGDMAKLRALMVEQPPED